MHPNELKIEELRKICKELYTSKSTNENLKKIKAVESQIARQDKEIEKEKNDAVKCY